MDTNLQMLLPEAYQLALICLLFLQSLGLGSGKPAVEKWLPIMAWLGVGMAILAITQEGSLLHGSYRIDRVSQYFKLLVSFGFAVAVLNATRQPTLFESKRADYFLFMALSCWGLLILSSAVELITIYLAMELSSYSLYAIVALRHREQRAAEAAIKYIFFGAVATALALYGFSYILATQHTSFIAELVAKNWHLASQPMAVVGMTLFMGGMFYKLALFPFHFWAPDVYQGASNETATFVATLPKLGALVVLIRLAAMFHNGHEIINILAVLAALSMTYGNLAALAQKDVKRILGYSAVAHAGYIMVGLVSGTALGLGAACFYALAYILMNFCCFWVICRVSGDGRNLTLNDLNGLHHRSPVLAMVLAVGAFSLVGLPPTAGFMGKLLLLTSAWDHGYNWLVILAAINTALSIYYYLNIVRHAYTKTEPQRPAAAIASPRFAAFWAGLLGALVLLCGAIPGPIFEAARAAGKQLLP